MDYQNHVSRRNFIHKTGQAAAGIIALGALSSCRSSGTNALPVQGRIIGANDRIRLGMIGVRSRGDNLIDAFGPLENVELAALCDIDGNVLHKRSKKVQEKFGNKPLLYKDERKLLENRDIDAVVIATPNHWHALGTIWACQAGKHVFVEKPCCHNVWEGRKMIEAARKYKRIVSVGFHNRSIKNVRKCIEFLQSGGIGKIYLARGLCFKARDPIGSVPDGLGQGPEYDYFIWGKPGIKYDAAYMNQVDYEMWLGPAPLRPFNYNRFHYNWHWNWDYGSGDNGNQGPHQWDIARWGLNKNEHPVKVTSTGGYFNTPSAQETPDTQTSQVEYADGSIIEFAVRGKYTNDESGVGIGNIFYGTKGWLNLNGSEWQSYFGPKNEPGPGSDSKDEEFADPMNLAGPSSGGHFSNFIYALRANDTKTLTCPIEEGYMSSALPLLTNIAYRLGRTLTFDGKKEKFVGDAESNKMLTRDYRKPYIVPEKV